MEFKEHHNLSDRAMSRIAQEIGMDVEIPTQPDVGAEEEARAEEIIQRIGAELRGESPTVTQLVLQRFADDVGLFPGYRGPARAKRKEREK